MILFDPSFSPRNSTIYAQLITRENACISSSSSSREKWSCSSAMNSLRFAGMLYATNSVFACSPCEQRLHMTQNERIFE